MNTNTLIIIVLLAAATLSTGVPPCPRQYDLGSVFSGNNSLI